MECLISDAITRNDIPAYSLQQIVELTVAEAEWIFGPKLEELQALKGRGRKRELDQGDTRDHAAGACAGDCNNRI